MHLGKLAAARLGRGGCCGGGGGNVQQEWRSSYSLACQKLERRTLIILMRKEWKKRDESVESSSSESFFSMEFLVMGLQVHLLFCSFFSLFLLLFGYPFSIRSGFSFPLFSKSVHIIVWIRYFSYTVNMIKMYWKMSIYVGMYNINVSVGTQCIQVSPFVEVARLESKKGWFVQSAHSSTTTAFVFSFLPFTLSNYGFLCSPKSTSAENARRRIKQLFPDIAILLLLLSLRSINCVDVVRKWNS